MTLDVFEFIRRFLLHVLPFKFVKIRHYGILSNCNRLKAIQLYKKLITLRTGKIHPKIELLSSHQLIEKMTGINIRLCPHCKKGNMQPKQYQYLSLVDSS